MSSEELTDRTDETASEEERDGSTLEAELEVLREENARLREEYARARQSQYRRTAITLVVVGLLAAVAGVLFPSARTVLFALGGTGVFVGVLTYYLTPEQFLPADVGRRVYEVLADNEADVISELGLREERVYVPTGASIDDVRLFVPQHADYEVPDADALADAFVVTDREQERGFTFEPTGTALATEFERALTGDLGDDPATLVPQLTDALVEQFELAASTDPEVDADGGRVTVGITGSAYGPVDRFDHPIASFLAVGLAHGLDEEVTVAVEAVADGRADYLVTCGWTPGEENETTTN